MLDQFVTDSVTGKHAERLRLRMDVDEPWIQRRFAGTGGPESSGFSCAVLKESPQAVAAAGMPQLAQCFGFDLANTLARDIELLTDLF